MSVKLLGDENKIIDTYSHRATLAGEKQMMWLKVTMNFYFCLASIIYNVLILFLAIKYLLDRRRLMNL